MKITPDDAARFSKDGIDLTKYVEGTPETPCDVLRVSVDDDHEREFSNAGSTFVYHVVEGTGTFWLDGDPTPVEPADTVVAEPGTRIYYRGDMELVLVSSPPYDEADDAFHGVGAERY